MGLIMGMNMLNSEFNSELNTAPVVSPEKLTGRS